MNNLLSKIEKEIPTLPTVVTRLLTLILDEKSSIKDISEVVQADQALVSKVLRVVNSAAYGFREKIATLDHAMSILGFETLKKLFLCVSVFDSLSQKDQAGYFFDKSHFWCHSLAAATMSRGIAMLVKYQCPDEAYVAGLLHDIGKIIAEQIMGDEYRSYMKKLNLNPTMSLQLEEESLSVNHAQVGKLAAEKWNFPLTLQKAIEQHHGTQSSTEEIHELAAIVSVADFICWTQALGSFNLFFQPSLSGQAEKIVDLKNLKIEALLEEMNQELALSAKLFNLKVKDVKGFREALQRANLELGKINSLYDDAKKKLEKHVQELNTLNDIVYKARKTLEPPQIIKNVLLGLEQGFGFSRLIWFSINQPQKMITPRAKRGGFQNNLPIISVGCNLNEEGALPLLKCIQNEKIFHIKENTDNSNCYLLKSLQSTEVLLVPISTDKKVTDLLLIDNQQGRTFVSPDTIKVLNILAVNLGMALENAKLFQHTAQMAIIDPLTNIYNRRQLDGSLDNEINRSARFRQPFSIAIFDIDHFKMVNDNYGHQAGDLVLKDAAAIIKQNSRNIDIVGRFGGDEFLVILPNTQTEGAFTFAERVRLVMQKYGLLRKKNFPQSQITLSIGVAGFHASMDTPERLLNKADKALYQSKQKGRNRVTIFEG